MLLLFLFDFLFILLISSLPPHFIHYLLSPSRFSLVNEVLIFNDSLIDLAPAFLIWLPIHFSFSFTFLISFLIFSSLPRYSSVSEVLFFKHSLIVLAPSSPIWLPIHFFILFLFFSLIFTCYPFITPQIQYNQCSIGHQ